MRKTKRNIARKAKRSANHQQLATSHGAARPWQGHTQQSASNALNAESSTHRTEPCPLGQGHTEPLASKPAEPEGRVLSAQVEGLGKHAERSETPAPRPINLEQTRLADATPSGHTVPADRSAPISHTVPQSGEPPAETVPQASHEPQTTSHGAQRPAASHGDGDERANRNRENAQRSTGPRTAEGKQAASRNAFKHGLSLQRHVILTHEDPAEFERLRVELREIFEPRAPREHLAVEDIAECRWALRRFGRGEATLLEYHFARDASPERSPDDRITYGEALGYCCLQEPDEAPRPELPSFLLLQRYRGHWDRRHQRALAEFDRAQRARRAEAAEDRKQSEALRKAEREAAAERRKEELHQLRLALAKEKLVREQERTGNARQQSAESSIYKALEQYLHAPPPGLTTEEMAALGFVSQSGDKPAVPGDSANGASGFVSSQPSMGDRATEIAGRTEARHAT